MALLGLYWSQIEAAETRGALAERAIWQKTAESNKRAADTLRIKLITEAREKEAAHAEKVALIDKKYQQELGRAKTQHETDLDNVRNGALRLRDPNAAGCRSAGGNPSPSFGSHSSIGNDRAAGELSAETVGFLLGIAREADEIVNQLTAAQQVILDYQSVCQQSL
jgi:hypothetical protein